MSYLMDLESVDVRRESSSSRSFESSSVWSMGYANSSFGAQVDEDEDEDDDLEEEGANSMQNQIDPPEDEEPMVDPSDEGDDEDLEDGEFDEAEEDAADRVTR